MNIEIIEDEDIELYTVRYNGEPILDCLSEKEAEKLTIGEIKRIADEFSY